MKKLTHYLLPYAAAIVMVAIAAGCASSKKVASVPSDAAADVHVDTAGMSDAAAVADAVNDDEDSDSEFVKRVPEHDPTEPEDEAEAEPDVIDVDALLEEARAASADAQFHAADSLLKRAARYLARDGHIVPRGLAPDATAADSADTETAAAALRDYTAEIMAIYADLMPSSFALPDEISSVIFTQRLFEALMTDTLELSHDDSVFIARLTAATTTYDVPMVWNDRVRRAFVFLTRTRKGSFERWLRRAAYYRPPMAQMFADSGLPRDLSYLPIIESTFNPHAYSRAHAAGIWQFIPSTGRNYGLRQNYWIDERRDPLKSTEAAIRYLRKLYNDFGDWHIALAAYNCGENGMARAIRRDGVHDYWQLKLPKETMNYIPLYLASVLIAKNPDVFGFTLQDTLIYDPDIVLINDCVEMKTIADGINLALDSLKQMNPQILHWCTPPDMKDVRLYLPKGYAEAFHAFYDTLSDANKTKFYRYRVQQGDNMLSIARNFRVPVDALREINKMRTNTLTAGQFLTIPIPVNESVPSHLAAHINQNENERLRRGRRGGGGNINVQPAARTGKKITYKVRPGETLYSLSQTFGVTVNDLMSWNNLKSPRSLRADQTLVIYLPGGGAPPARPAPAQERVRGSTSEHTGKRMVRQGDTLYGIAMELGLTVSELARINGLDTRRPLIFPGDILVYTPKTQKSGGN